MLRSNTISPAIWRTPWRCTFCKSNHNCSCTREGSPLPFRYRLPCSVSPFSLPSCHTVVCQRKCGPNSSKAAAVVTNFITEAGVMACVTLWLTKGAPPSTGTTKNATSSSATPLRCKACATLSGSELGTGCAPAEHSAPNSRAAVQIQCFVFAINCPSDHISAHSLSHFPNRATITLCKTL